MDSLGLVVHDDSSFFSKVVALGVEQDIFTRDRADEIVRISVAMANKYVMHKEVDFRSQEELEKVQETILKLVGVGLEIKSQGKEGEAIHLLMDLSPVELFRLAYTRVEKVRHLWRLLLQDHRVEILVSSREFECMNDLTCQRLQDMSVFTESELYTIRSTTLEDRLFSSLSLLEYYEGELLRYQFILRLKGILPFALLNRSSRVRAENLAEVDSIREALIDTLIIAVCSDAPEPLPITVADVRRFLEALELTGDPEMFPPQIEDVVVDLIEELGEGLEDAEISLLTHEMVRVAQKLYQTILTEWDSVTSPVEMNFFQRWCRLAILSDEADALERLGLTGLPLDEFEFEVMLEQLLSQPEGEATDLIARLPWDVFTPKQVIRLFHEAPPFQESFAQWVNLSVMSPPDIIDLLEGIEPEAWKKLFPALKKAFAEKSFTLEDLEVLIGMQHPEIPALLMEGNPPEDLDQSRVLSEYRSGSESRRKALFFSCLRAPFFSELFYEAWHMDPGFVKQRMKRVPAQKVGGLLLAAAGNARPDVVTAPSGESDLAFQDKHVSALYRALPKTKRAAAVKFFSKQS